MRLSNMGSDSTLCQEAAPHSCGSIPVAGGVPYRRGSAARGQASVEIILVIALIMALSLTLVSRELSTQESVFMHSAVRQELISEIGLLDAKYDVNNIRSAECLNEIKIDISVKAQAQSALRELEDTVGPKLVQAARNSRNTTKTITISFNKPENLVCT